MKVVAAGQNRNHGWNDIVAYDLANVRWKGGSDLEAFEQHNVKLQLNGSYKVQLIFTKDDARALAAAFLTKADLVKLARLTDEDKIGMAKHALAKSSTGDKPDVKILFGMVEAMLPRQDVVSLLKLTDDEKIDLAWEKLRKRSFEKVIALLYNKLDQEDTSRNDTKLDDAGRRL
jgi:hypothetical protein